MRHAVSQVSRSSQVDVVVVGTGGAGLRAAIEARRQGADVLVVSKAGPDDPNSTVWAWGGFTYALAEHAPELFGQVVETGGFLSDQRLVEVFARDTPERVAELRTFGVELDVLDRADEQRRLGLVKVPGQGRTTGFGLTRPLRSAATALGVRFADGFVVSALLKRDDRVTGCLGVDLAVNWPVVVTAGAVVLGCGGGAGLYERSDNPQGTTADGIALAYQAGAELVDLECVSFNLSDRQLAEVRALRQPEPRLFGAGCAHYFLGGIRIDTAAQTTIPGLFAAGEVTGGLFGAARLGGSALADTVVFGTIAGASAARWAAAHPAGTPDNSAVEAVAARLQHLGSGGGAEPSAISTALRQVMWRQCGPMKTRASIEAALAELARLGTQARTLTAGSGGDLLQAIECENMLTVARLICQASLCREETRGCFWRLDFPEPDNAKWPRNVCQWQGDDGDACCETRPVVMTRLAQPTQPRIGAGCFSYLPSTT